MRDWRHTLGLDTPWVGAKEACAGAIGGGLSMAAVWWCTSLSVHGEARIPVLGSMGAAAVLLFTVPHGRLSQPWNLLAGNLISAIIGVALAQAVADPRIAAPLAVGIAIGAMYLCRCMHPPGGATALIAVIGGSDIASLGYAYIPQLVLPNILAMLAIALVFNNIFTWRRYPAALQTAGDRTELSATDVRTAAAETGLLVDVSDEDLIRLYRLARQRAAARQKNGEDHGMD